MTMEKVTLTHQQIRKMLFTRCEQAGGCRKFAEEVGLSPSIISMVLTHSRPPSPSILNALGYVVTPEFICVGQAGATPIPEECA
ncbi:hypothetical protein GbCGDNIH2_7307 [Granulibacter bethesdensis]|nr:hypothetical protein GbCGDNIH2_7307 [Granulibacter bethesdensis]